MTEDEFYEKHGATLDEMSDEDGETLALFARDFIVSTVEAIESAALADRWPDGVSKEFVEVVRDSLGVVVREMFE